MKPLKIDDVVDAYIAHGHRHGFASAECVLADFLPKGELECLCCKVPRDKWARLRRRLRGGSIFKKRKLWKTKPTVN